MSYFTDFGITQSAKSCVFIRKYYQNENLFGNFKDTVYISCHNKMVIINIILSTFCNVTGRK